MNEFFINFFPMQILEKYIKFFILLIYFYLSNTWINIIKLIIKKKF